MKALLVVLMLVLLPSAASAIDLVVNEVGVTVSYVEPVENEDGTPLLDLDRTVIMVKDENGTYQEHTVVPASSPSGGQPVSVDLLIPVSTNFVEIGVFACDAALSRGDNVADNCSEIKEVVRALDKTAPGPVQ